ncbi:hypothetical protein CPB86DRAFT_791118 [Serendipita vermifera]|nr:hypothetical protein CPB86DRAFT_791118 [Serendipita vermifera]
MSEEFLAKCTETVPKMLFRAVPTAESIAFCTINVPNALRFLELEGWTKVKDLGFQCDGKEGPVGSSIELPPQVEYASLTCILGSLSSIHSISTRRLSVWDSYESPYDESCLPLLTSLNWPQLEIMDVDSNALDWRKTTLRTLKSITLQEKRSDDQEITLDGHPEWDVLAIMLEHRNLLAGPHIRRIEKVSIPSVSPSQICQVISSLLKGKWLPRPSNKELSLAGNVKAILDPAIPGCLMCHRLLRDCTEPVKDVWKLEALKDDSTLLLQLQEYPYEDEVILNTWETRTTLWENSGIAAGRRHTCSKGNFFSTKAISPDLY